MLLVLQVFGTYPSLRKKITHAFVRRAWGSCAEYSSWAKGKRICPWVLGARGNPFLIIIIEKSLSDIPCVSRVVFVGPGTS